jgi:hypothetical protein
MDDSSPNILPNNRLTAAASAITTAPPTKPGDMKAVMQRIRARQAATAQLAIDTEQHVETTMARCDALLMAAQAEANEVMDELNQLTNGGPV